MCYGNGDLADLDINGFVNPPILVVGTWNFKFAVDTDFNLWATELHADSDLLGWNDLLDESEEFTIQLICDTNPLIDKKELELFLRLGRDRRAFEIKNKMRS